MGRLSCITTLLVIGLLLGVTSAGAQSNQQTVPIRDFSFEPAQLSVEPGTTVTWTNEGNQPPTVTADNGLFDSGVLYPGDSYSVQFDGMGTVSYYCTLHPSMTGGITVGGGTPVLEQPVTEQSVMEQPASTGGY
jgi:plastocyanin